MSLQALTNVPAHRPIQSNVTGIARAALVDVLGRTETIMIRQD